MVKDIKSCFKLLKYGYQLKSSMLSALIFLVLGIVYAFIAYEQFQLCVVYIFLAITMVSQQMSAFLFSGFVAASPSRRKIEFLYMDILNVILGVMGVLFVLFMAFFMEPDELDYTSVEVLLVVSGFTIIVMYVYMSMAFKTVIVGTILFIGAFMGLMIGTTGFLSRLLLSVMEGKRVLAVAIFLVEFVIGLVLSSAIRRVLYRKSISKWALGAKLRMEQS